MHTDPAGTPNAKQERLAEVGALACGAAHDLNNLLTVILGRAELGRMQCGEDPKLNMTFQQLLETAHKATTITRQLLLLARADDGQRQRLDVNAVSAAYVRLAAEENGDAFAILHQPSSELASVDGDATQIEQILRNLEAYVRDMPGDHRSMRLSVDQATVTESTARKLPSVKPGTYVRITAAGPETPPIPAAQRVPYEPTAARRQRGTSLGLAVAHLLARAHGGFMEVSVGLREGAVVYVYLPLAEGASRTMQA